MKSRILWALVALNVFLLVVLVARSTTPNYAMAQAARPSDYLMIPGEITGGNGAVVYVLDMTNGVLGGLTWDESRRDVSVMPPLDLSRFMESSNRGGRR
ncbi:MAG: hypothetical protein IT447_12540 [Phycisphaerales bacterium]|jgi:hypothetical protein|nr:hypothetical protein [Phycisphaerales bacterium]